MNKILNREKTIIGGLLVMLSIFLGIFYEYKNFYELLLLGILIIEMQLAIVHKIPKEVLIKLYGLYFTGGIFGDLLLGILSTNLWYYNYNSPIQYISLYLWIYPIGGITFVIFFLSLLDLFNIRVKINHFKHNYKDEIIFSVATLLNLVVILLLKLSTIDRYLGFSLFVIIATLSLFTINNYIEKNNNNSLFYIFKNNPKKVLIAIILSVLCMSLIHEFPNTFAKQWVYTKNHPFVEYTILRVPIIVIIEWFALLILPFEVFLKFFSNREFNNLIED